MHSAAGRLGRGDGNGYVVGLGPFRAAGALLVFDPDVGGGSEAKRGARVAKCEWSG